MFTKKYLLAGVLLSSSLAFAGVDDTTATYRATNNSSPAGVVILQSANGFNAVPVNADHPLSITCVSGCSGGGGGGDATAANQITGNASLSSIDTKTPALVSGRQPVDGSGVTQPISAASLPLPSGAATAAKQPALGTAGSASTDVLTVQGIAAGTPLIVGGAVASGATDSGNPNKTGGVYNSTAPTFTTGQRGDTQLDSRGSTKVIAYNGANVLSGAVPSTDGAAAPNAASFVTNYPEVWNGATYDRQRGDVNGMVNQPYAMTGSRWQYAAASGGISNTTTAVTMNAAAGAGVRNYVTSCQISSDTLGVATELAIRDGAAGTVIWRTKLQTTFLPSTMVTFAVPLKGTANTLVEIVTLTASVTGGVFVNCQGFTGT